MSLLATIFTHPLVEATLRIIGLSLLAATVTALTAFVFRARVRSTLPEGATLIIGLGVVAIYLNTRLVFVQFVGDGEDPLTTAEALLNIAVFISAGVASYGGRYVGTKAGASDRVGWTRLQPDFSPIVRATGRFITVTLPEDVEDIDGYDPVAEKTKTALAGKTLDFPRGLTLAELRTRLTVRLTEEHDIGYVDIDLADDGTVEYLAVGQRVAGLGPTLPPKSMAVALRGDPPFGATPGDTVQLWRLDSEGKSERLGVGELRAAVDDVVTIATDEAVAQRVDPADRHRLMTLPTAPQPDREFAAMLRHGEETMSVVEIAADSPLVGSALGSLAVTTIAVRTPDGEVWTLPKRDREIQSGDCLFALGSPDALRKLESTSGTKLVVTEEVVEDVDADVGAWESTPETPAPETRD